MFRVSFLWPPALRQSNECEMALTQSPVSTRKVQKTLSCLREILILLYFKGWWTSRLLPCPGYYKQCCNEHWGTSVSFNSGFLSVPSNEYSGLISFSLDWLGLHVVQGTLKSLLQHQFKSINSSALSFLYSPKPEFVCSSPIWEVCMGSRCAVSKG